MEAEIWDIWLEFAKENLPLPLGGMALRRSLPLSDAIKIERDLTNAVKLPMQIVNFSPYAYGKKTYPC